MSNTVLEQSPTIFSAPAFPELSAEQRAALAAIVAAAEDGHAFAAVIGKEGTGKTTVLDAAASMLGRPPLQVIRFAAECGSLELSLLLTFVAGRDFCPGERAERVAEPQSSSPPLITRTLLLIDNAHMLRREAFACLLAASQTQSGDPRNVQIVFAGRPSFWSLLKATPLQPLRERIAFREMLGGPSLAREEGPAATSTRLWSSATLRRRAVRWSFGSAVAATFFVTAYLVDPHAMPGLTHAMRAESGAQQTRSPSANGAGALLAPVANPSAPVADPPAAVQVHTEPAASAALRPHPNTAPSQVGFAGDARTSAGQQRTSSAAAPVAAPPTISRSSPRIPPAQPATAATRAQSPSRPPQQTAEPTGAATMLTVAAPFSEAEIPSSAPANWAGKTAPPVQSPHGPPTVHAAGPSAPPPISPPAADPTSARPNSSTPTANEALMGTTIPQNGAVVHQPEGKSGSSAPSPESSLARPAAAPAAPPASRPAVGSPAPGESAGQPRATLPAAMIAVLLKRGDDMMRIGDIGAARLLYGRAAEAGNGSAALAIGKTYDPRALADMGVRGIAPDPNTAAEWYRRAVALGDRDADRLLAEPGPAAQ